MWWCFQTRMKTADYFCYFCFKILFYWFFSPQNPAAFEGFHCDLGQHRSLVSLKTGIFPPQPLYFDADCAAGCYPNERPKILASNPVFWLGIIVSSDNHVILSLLSYRQTLHCFQGLLLGVLWIWFITDDLLKLGELCGSLCWSETCFRSVQRNMVAYTSVLICILLKVEAFYHVVLSIEYVNFKLLKARIQDPWKIKSSTSEPLPMWKIK